MDEQSAPANAVYVVEDDAGIAVIVRRACMTLGIEAFIFDGADEFVAAEPPPPGSTILLDLGLGQSNGIDVLRFLAARRCEAAIYLMSGQDERLLHTIQKLGQSYGLNVAGILQKPFRLADLTARLRAVPAAHPGARVKRQSQAEELHRAIMSGELRLHYQPKVGIATHIMVGCEALVRWEHPERGLLPPGEFLPAAQANGLMPPMTHWVLDEALRQIAAWRDRGQDINVAVNMPADMLSELDLPATIERLLARHEVDGASLTLEVTEAAAMRGLLTAVDVLARLRLMRISLSIDDFGTGHSSMIKLRQLPFNEIKIDQSFVQDIASDYDARAIVGAALGMARSFVMKCVAEGVETADGLALLAELGCDVAQGYHFSRPLPPDGLLAWAQRNEDSFRGAVRLPSRA